MVVVPEGSPRGLLIPTMHLMFTIGFAMIGLRFLLRMLLVLSGHQSVEPEPDEFEGAKATGAEVEALADELVAPISGSKKKAAAPKPPEPTEDDDDEPSKESV